MTLMELCEPLFQYLCRLNRAARKGGRNDDEGAARRKLTQLFKEMQEKADAAQMVPNYEQVRLPLVFFVDYMIRTSSLPFAATWRNLAMDESPPVRRGNEEFFEHLNQALHEHSDASRERLVVLYTCLGLGFTGALQDDPEAIRHMMEDIAVEIHGMLGGDDPARICRDAYENVRTDDLTGPPLRPLTPIAIVLVGLLLVLFVATGWLYHRLVADLGTSIESVSQKADKALAESSSPKADKALAGDAPVAPTSQPTTNR